MAKLLVLDTGVLGVISNPKATLHNLACGQWLAGHLSRNALVFVPEIVDYEVRRELLSIMAKTATGYAVTWTSVLLASSNSDMGRT